MPLISQFFGIKIYMYIDDHNPPHFHAKYGEHEVQVRIEDTEVMNGSLPGRTINFVREWAALHKTDLLENWDLTHSGNSAPKRIEPLE